MEQVIDGITINPDRKQKIGYNPQTGSWHMKCNGVEYISDIESVKNMHFIESAAMNIYRHAEISEAFLCEVKSRNKIAFDEFKADYPTVDFTPLFFKAF